MSPSNFTLLFAEDNPSIMALYKKAFTQEGFKVLASSNAAEAMAELQDVPVDLLVTDLAMPEANTFDLFKLLKEKYPKLPVIIVSGKYQDLQEDFLNKGYKVTAFLQKPVELTALKAKVAEVLGIVPGGKVK
ncbi:MAG TPA: response regulator [bacterium]|nr:response regulator [bacterium]